MVTMSQKSSVTQAVKSVSQALMPDSPRGSIGGTYEYAPSYWHDGGRYYFGRPGFSHGRWNGGSYGPCWTYTPIGRMWNCG
jgi:hypothetical protein